MSERRSSMTSLVSLIKLLLGFADAVLGVWCGYGIVLIVQGRADDNPKSVADGLKRSIVSAVLIAVATSAIAIADTL